MWRRWCHVSGSLIEASALCITHALAPYSNKSKRHVTGIVNRLRKEVLIIGLVSLLPAAIVESISVLCSKGSETVPSYQFAAKVRIDCCENPELRRGV